MFKFCLAVVLATQVMGLSYGLLGEIIATAINLSQDGQSVEIGQLGDVGYIAIPFNTVCYPPVVGDYLFCALCNQDCIYAHNTYGGKCGPSPLNDGTLVCLCANTPEEAAAQGVSISTRDTCGYNIIPPLVTLAQDTLFKAVITARAQIAQCAGTGITTSACYTDCSVNHGVNGGTCLTVLPKETRSGLVPELYCQCGNP